MRTTHRQLTRGPPMKQSVKERGSPCIPQQRRTQMQQMQPAHLPCLSVGTRSHLELGE